MNDTPKPWYAHHGNYEGKYPPFFNLRGLHWYDKLLADLPEIKDLLQLDKLNTKRHFDTDRVEGQGWLGEVFLFWGVRNEKAIQKTSALFEYLKDIPGIVQISVSVLNPKTRIKAHTGDTDAIYRLHIPISIPSQLPECGLTVAGITRPWDENDIIVFCDAYLHEAWNMTDKIRVILIVDVLQEEFLSQSDKICRTVLAAMKYQYIAAKVPFLKNAHKWVPKWIKNIVRKIL
jgi:hypothetical protein